MSENGIIAYDLEPPLMPRGTGHPITPRHVPFRDRGERSPMPRYVPLPQPEGTVRVVLESSGPDGEPADFQMYDDYPTLVEPYRVFDVPAGQYERWREAKEAFGAMEEEIEALISDHARDPLPRPSPGLPC
jgi:hypothetical protein